MSKLREDLDDYIEITRALKDKGYSREEARKHLKNTCNLSCVTAILDEVYGTD